MNNAPSANGVLASRSHGSGQPGRVGPYALVPANALHCGRAHVATCAQQPLENVHPLVALISERRREIQRAMLPTSAAIGNSEATTSPPVHLPVRLPPGSGSGPRRPLILGDQRVVPIKRRDTAPACAFETDVNRVSGDSEPLHGPLPALIPSGAFRRVRVRHGWGMGNRPRRGG